MTTIEGWVKLYRKFLSWEWYTDHTTKSVFIHLLIIANIQDKKWQGRTIKRGQVLTNVRHLAESLELANNTILASLKKLKSTNEIEIKADKKFGSLITIVKYDDYQSLELSSVSMNDTPTDTPTDTPSVSMVDTNIRINNKKNNIIVPQPSCDTQIEQKSEGSRMMKRPTLDEIQSYINEQRYSVNAERFFAFYESNGWKVGKNPMKSWKSALKTWQLKETNYGNYNISKADQYSKRRGFEISATSAKDYEGAF